MNVENTNEVRDADEFVGVNWSRRALIKVKYAQQALFLRNVWARMYV